MERGQLFDNLHKRPAGPLRTSCLLLENSHLVYLSSFCFRGWSWYRKEEDTFSPSFTPPTWVDTVYDFTNVQNWFYRRQSLLPQAAVPHPSLSCHQVSGAPPSPVILPLGGVLCLGSSTHSSTSILGPLHQTFLVELWLTIFFSSVFSKFPQHLVQVTQFST